MLRVVAALLLVAACADHGKSPGMSDAATADAGCPGRSFSGHVRDLANSQAPGLVTFTIRDGGTTTHSAADGAFDLCGPAAEFIADVTPPPALLPGILVAPVFTSTTSDGSFHVLVFSEGDAAALFAQFSQAFDPAAGQLLVHQVLGQDRPTLTGGTGATITAVLPGTWMTGNDLEFVMFTNVTPGMQRYAPSGTAGPSIPVPVEAGHVTYLMSLIVPD